MLLFSYVCHCNGPACLIDAISLPQTGVMLKPFLPQLQTTFVKAVHDAHRGVRLRAGAALAHLITIHTKPDPLFTELHNAVKAADDTPTR